MNKKLLIIIVLAVVVLGGGGAAAMMFLGGDDPEVVEEVEAPQPGLMPLDPFIVNLKEPDQKNFVKLSLQITLSPAERIAELSENQLLIARCRDRILTLLSSKSYSELSSPLGREALRREIKARLEPLFDGEDDKLEDILFSEFMVQ